MADKKGLGRGLGALLGDAAGGRPEETGVMLRIAEIEPNADQPRKNFDETALSELADSIRLNGVLTPLLVRRLESGSYQIIAGERRWRAARMAGVTRLPAVVIEADDRRVTELALIENLQREDLNPMEEAEGYKSLSEEFGLTQEEISRRVGRSRPAVANAMRLLSLPEALQKMVSEGTLSSGHARPLLALPSPKLQEQAAKQVIKDELSVRQTETLVKKLLQEKKEQTPDMAVNYLEEHEKRLSSSFARKVRIVSGRQKGRIELEFYGAEDFEELMALLEERSRAGS